MSTTSEIVERLKTRFDPRIVQPDELSRAAALRLDELERENARLRAALDETILDLRIYTDIGIITSRAIERRAALAGSGEK
jgi:hypothetical protein